MFTGAARLTAKQDGLWLHLSTDGKHGAINLSLATNPDTIVASIVECIRADLLVSHLDLEPKSLGKRP